MNLFLLRHAEAVKLGAHGFLNDRKRALNKVGIEQSEIVARAVIAMNLRFDVILCSTYLRAKQTAAILTQQCDFLPKPVYTASLAVEAKILTFIESIGKRYHSYDSILVVGHNPFLTELVSILISGQEDAGIVVKKAELIKLKIFGQLQVGKCAQLQWKLPARLLELLCVK